jgi:hypothetical protein
VIGLVARSGGRPAYTVPAEPPVAWRPNGIFYNGTPHADVLHGSALNDVIRVNGGGRDRVTCARGSDVVYADRRDRIARDCERVTRLP